MNQTSPNSTLITCGPFAFIPLNPTNISYDVQYVLIATIAINGITCPVIILLNTLVIVAVKTKRQLRTTSNIVLACLATTDFVLGLAVQPLLIAAFCLLLKGDAGDFCSVSEMIMIFTTKCYSASFNHLLLMSGERYFAIKHPFAYETRVTEVRIILAAGLAWLAAIVPPAETSFKDGQVSSNILSGLIMIIIFFALMVYFNVAVYREVRRIEKHIIANQVSLEAKTKLLKNKKAFYTTTIVLLIIFFCYFPGNFCIAILMSFRHIIPVNVGHIVLNLAPLLPILNSLFNPLIYAVRIRYFRVAFIQLLSRRTFAQAENVERSIFGPRQIGVVAVTEQEHSQQCPQN